MPETQPTQPPPVEAPPPRLDPQGPRDEPDIPLLSGHPADPELATAQMRAFAEVVGRDITQVPSAPPPGPHLQAVNPPAALRAAARPEVAKLDNLTATGTFSGPAEIAAAWRDLRAGEPVAPGDLERLRTVVGSLAEATRNLGPDLIPATGWRLAEVALTPDDRAEVRLVPPPHALADIASRLGPLQPHLAPAVPGRVVAQHADGSLGLVAPADDTETQMSTRTAYPTVLTTPSGEARWRTARPAVVPALDDRAVLGLAGEGPYDLRADPATEPPGLAHRPAWALHVKESTLARELAERLKGEAYGGAKALPPHQTQDGTRHTVLVPLDAMDEDLAGTASAVLEVATGWAERRGVDVEPVGYLPLSVSGMETAWEWQVHDEAGRTLAYRTTGDGSRAPHATPVQVQMAPPASATPPSPTTPLNDTEFAYGGVRVLHAAEKIGTNKKGPIHFSYDGRRPRAFAVAMDAGKAPRVAIGTDPAEVSGRVPGGVLVERKGDGLLITTPDGKLDTAVDGLEVLHRLGLPTTPTKVMVLDAEGTEVARFGKSA